MSERLPSAVPMSAAGIVYQFERALYHLSRLPPGLRVGIEAIDDIAVEAVDGTIWIVEQDKLTSKMEGYDLSDRSEAVWKTLRNWLNAYKKHRKINAFFFVTNGPINGKFINLLGRNEKTDDDVKHIVDIILGIKCPYKENGEMKGVTKIIKEVQSHGKEAISELVRKIIVQFDSEETRREDLKIKTIENLHVPSSIDCDILYRGLYGWLVEITMANWSAGRNAWISGQLFANYLYEIKGKIMRKKVREMASVYIPVTSEQIDGEKSSRFVHHLAEIHADSETVIGAITDYIQFSQEKMRLTLDEGAVDEEDWWVRGARLIDRWKKIRSHNNARPAGRTPQEIGQDVLFKTTSDHLEPFGDHMSENIYLTSGHYHRLANNDFVCWSPHFQNVKKYEK